MVDSLDNMIIYKVTSPSGKIYIGLTKHSLEVRKYGHIRQSKKSNLPFHNALKKYGEQLIWEVIAKAETYEQLQELEKFYINEFKSNVTGYNRTSGGEGVNGLQHKKSTKKVLSKKSKNQWTEMTDEAKAERVRNNLNYAGANKRSVIDSKGNIFISLTDAGKFHEVTPGAVAFAIKHKRMCKNLYFKYYENEEKCPDYNYIKKSSARVYTEEQKLFKQNNSKLAKPIVDNLGREYVSISMASRLLKISRDLIKASLNKNKELKNGLRFYYGI